MASPAFGAIAALTNISASTSVPRPSVSSGDLMILAVIGAYGDATITPPSGWTALASIDQGSAFEHELRLYWKIAGGSEASTYTVAIGGQGGGNNFGYGLIWTYTGHDATTPIQVSATQRNTSSSTSATCPSVTTTSADTTLVCVYVSGNNSVSNTWTPPSGMTERQDGGANPTGFVVGVADLAVASSGATGTKTATSSISGTSNAISFAIASYVAPDTTAPTLTSPTGTATGSTTATVGATTDEGNGTLYAVVTTSGTAPSAAQVKAGQNSGGTSANWSGSVAVSSTGAKTLNATGLTASTAYYAHLMHEDAAANQANVVSSSSFTTSAGSSAKAGVLYFYQPRNCNV